MRVENGVLTKVQDSDIPLLKADPQRFWENVNIIGYEAFSGCKTLTSIVIPNCIEVIGMFAFSSCPNLQKVDMLTNYLQTIGKFMFVNSPKLREVIMHKDLKVDRRFLGCGPRVKLKFLEIASDIDCEFED